MKPLPIVLTAAILLTVGAGTQDNSSPGRFQIITARDLSPRGVEIPVTFKLDSATGRTWEYQIFGVFGPTNGMEYVYGWQEMTERSAAARMAGLEELERNSRPKKSNP